MPLGTIRAFQLDLARQIETLPAVFRFFDVAAASGYNMCVLYLEDRIKTASYPYSPDEESYSPDQIREMIAYADKLGLELVPVVSNLGHTERFLRHPQLQHLAELRGHIAGRFAPAGQASYNVVCPLLPETAAFFDTYLAEVAALFPSPYFHVGLDEVWDMGLCAECEPFVKEHGLGELFLRHVIRTHNVLQKLGKTMMMWDDMFENFPGLLERVPSDIVMTAWYYDYIDRYPDGHFDNRRREDVFAEYDRLGIRYLASTGVSPSSSTGLSNNESFTAYADRYHPLGMFGTLWEKERVPLDYLHPLVAQAGLLWQGKFRYDPLARLTEAVRLCCRVAGEPCSDAFARAAAGVLQYATPVFGVSAYPGQIELPHPDSMHNDMTRALLLGLLTDAGESPYADAVRYYAELPLLQTRIHTLALRMFDFRTGEHDCCLEDLRKDIDACAAEVARVQSLLMKMWDKSRPGLAHGAADKQFAGMARVVEKLREEAAAAAFGDTARLDVKFFAPDQHGAPRTRIDVLWTDGSADTVCDACVKSCDLERAFFSVAFRLPQGKTPATVRISESGYGDCGYAWVEIRSDGRYVPAAIGKCAGVVEHPDRLLTDDTRVALLGEPEHQRPFDFPGLQNAVHSMTVLMKKA